MTQTQEQVPRRGRAQAAARRRDRRDAIESESADWRPDWYRCRRTSRAPRTTRTGDSR